MKIKVIVCFLSLFLTFPGSSLAVVTLGGGRIVELQDGTQLIFDISEAAAPKTFLLANPPRYVIDLPNAATQDLNLNLRSRDIRNVRMGSPNGRDLRIVLDLNDLIRGKASIVKDQRHRLVIDLFRNQPSQAINQGASKQSVQKVAVEAPPIEMVSTSSTARTGDLPALELLSPAQIQAQAQAREQERAREQARAQEQALAQAKAREQALAQAKAREQALAQAKAREQALAQAKAREQALAQAKKAQEEAAQAAARAQTAAKPTTPLTRKKRDIVIAIDPGHGGKDSGAVGPGRTREKDVVLQIAKRLKKAIDKEPGMSAFLTRDGDYYLKLYRRIAIARSKKADLFVSIHADAYFDARPQGASVFMLSTKGASSTMARWLAESENKSDLIDDELDIADKQVRQIVFDMVHDAVLADSNLMGNKVLKQLRQVGKLHSRKIERANFAVLKSPDIPSILVETAFISNPNEERKLRSASYQNKLANAILQGIRAYAQERPQLGVELVETSAADQRHLVQRGDTLHGIAAQYNVSLDRLISTNGLNRQDPQLSVGARLRIPRDG